MKIVRMVSGWETVTVELSRFEEKVLLPIIVNVWKKKDAGQVVTMRAMIDGMNKLIVERNIVDDKGRVRKISGPRMRKIIHHIRVNGIIPNLVASSKGYYLTNDRDDIIRFAKSCSERANSFNQVFEAMLKHNNIKTFELNE